MPIKQITIIGVGLIGGSFALAAKKHGFQGKIIGCDTDSVLEKALPMGVVDVAESRPEHAIKGSDVVLLATPVGGIIDLVERIGPLLPEHALLTDVGSTKTEIVFRADSVFGKKARQRFLPGHPMAGKAHGGVTRADADLFSGAVWIFTNPHSQAINSPGLAADFADLVRRIGARPVTMDVARHDHLTGWISHLPQMISTAFAAMLMDEFGNDFELQAVGGRPLKEMTRIAASPYSMWRDIAHTNTQNLEDALQHLEHRLAHIRENLRGPALRDEFERANAFRAEPEMKHSPK
jgi:prephenate dehydrogenase